MSKYDDYEIGEFELIDLPGSTDKFLSKWKNTNNNKVYKFPVVTVKVQNKLSFPLANNGDNGVINRVEDHNGIIQKGTIVLIEKGIEGFTFKVKK